PISYDSAKSLKKHQDQIIEELTGDLPDLDTQILSAPENPILYEFRVSKNAPKVTYRQAGDRYILVEYGDNLLDLNLAYRIHKLDEMVKEYKPKGIFELSQGVRSVLVEFTDEITQKQALDTLVSYERENIFVNKWEVKSRIIKLPMAFEDKKTLDAVKRYQETIRSEAPWLPNNVDFIANINGITRNDVKDMLYTARFLVLGLGDVFLGAP
ncbi:Multifunctional urea amidolyase, partial [Candida maltosa Xu316]